MQRGCYRVGGDGNVVEEMEGVILFGAWKGNKTLRIMIH